MSTVSCFCTKLVDQERFDVKPISELRFDCRSRRSMMQAATKRLALLAALVGLAPIARAEISATPVMPAQTHGCGTVEVSTVSKLIVTKNVTLCPGSPALPILPQIIYVLPWTITVLPGSQSPVVLCVFGGVCEHVGQIIPIGGTATKNVQSGSSPPSVVALAGTATIYIEW